ncbi:MAG: hypothetical protein AXW12_03450 [Thalassospira sp. Nap_22]|nr:MAG: hypothetical protein AXW12_03450 [Thalassospira sp. Nap_22]
MAVDDLSYIETEMRSLWTADGTTPFIADLQMSEELFASAKRAARQNSIKLLVSKFPTLGVWAVLYPLLKNYAAKDRDVYRHLEEFLNETLDNNERRVLKSCFVTAARQIGIPIAQSTDLTQVFFAPLGAPEPQHSNLARAFLCTAIFRGPPAIEDTVAARHWQRLAVANYCSTQPRLKAPIWFDESAYYARRFDAWRHGDAGVGLGEAALFAAYDRFAKQLGRKRSDFIGAPAVVWHRNGLALLPETASKTQTIKDGLFPRQVPGGKPVSVQTPWPETIKWWSEAASFDVAFAPQGNEVLVFDADSGTLIQRVENTTSEIEVAATHLIALCRSTFSSPSFGNAIKAADPTVLCAWFGNNETITFADRGPLKITAPIDTAIWFDGTVIGRNGASALYANDLMILLRLDPSVGGSERIVRARLGQVYRYRNVNVDSNNEARMAIANFGFDPFTAPGKIIFEVLVPGAAGNLNARADAKATCWVWPNVTPPEGDLENVQVPSNYSPERSAGLHVDSYGRLSVDPHAEAETPILGLTLDKQTYEFDLVARSEKLWHFRIASNDQVFVPKGGTITIGYNNRHDMLRLRCHDRDADLIVLGYLIKRPFIQRQIVEIGSEKLEKDTGDDRIAIKRSDGRLELLARLRRVTDTGAISLQEDDQTITLCFRPCDDPQGIRIEQENVRGENVIGEYGFGVIPTERPQLQGILVTANKSDGFVTISVDKSSVHGPGRLTFRTISSTGALEVIKDAARAPLAIGLVGDLPNADRSDLASLAKLLTDPEPDALSGHVSKALYPTYQAAFNAVGSNRSIGAIKGALNTTPHDGGIARHDIVGVAPWVFEAGAHALSGLSEGTGFSTLSLLTEIPMPSPKPDLDCQHPLGEWLRRIEQDENMPHSLKSDALRDAFVDLRFRLRETDLKELLGDGIIGNTCRIICRAHAEHIDDLRAFDTAGGGDPVPARLAVQVERFARACAQKRTEEFLKDLIIRTGLSRQDIGYTMTMMLRASVRFFVYFRALWGHAAS